MDLRERALLPDGTKRTEMPCPRIVQSSQTQVNTKFAANGGVDGARENLLG
jgi:hypothetical protein